MNSFRLPYHLIVEQGLFSRIPEVMADAIPNIGSRKTILVTEQNLVNIFGGVITRLQGSFPNMELYLLEQQNFDNAVALAKYITMNEITLIIGFGGGTVLDLAKFASFVSKTTYICLPTTLSNDSLASPVAVLEETGDRPLSPSRPQARFNL